MYSSSHFARLCNHTSTPRENVSDLRRCSILVLPMSCVRLDPAILPAAATRVLRSLARDWWLGAGEGATLHTTYGHKPIERLSDITLTSRIDHIKARSRWKILVHSTFCLRNSTPNTNSPRVPLGVQNALFGLALAPSYKTQSQPRLCPASFCPTLDLHPQYIPTHSSIRCR